MTPSQHRERELYMANLFALADLNRDFQRWERELANAYPFNQDAHDSGDCVHPIIYCPRCAAEEADEREGDE